MLIGAVPAPSGPEGAMGFGRRCGGTKSSQKHKNGEYLYQKNSVNGFGLRVPAKLQ